MKTYLAQLLLFVCFSFTNDTLFDYKITLMNGVEKPLSDYSGKNIMIAVLPAIRNDTNSNLLSSLDSLQRELADSLIVIGIPSYEDGYADDSLESVVAWYQSVFDTSFVLAQGMNTRKSSPYQSGLFHWLTHAEENGHFDQDVMGAGEKFILSKDGLLHSLISPGATLDSETLQQILNSNE